MNKCYIQLGKTTLIQRMAVLTSMITSMTQEVITGNDNKCQMAPAKLKVFERWPCGQTFHDLVGHLIKLGGHNELFVSVTIK